MPCNREEFLGNKKAEHPRTALRPRPDQEPTTPNANRSIRQDCAKIKTQSHWTQFTRGVVDKTFLLGRFWTYLPKNANSFQLAVIVIDNAINI